jgi:hypothetical protein
LKNTVPVNIFYVSLLFKFYEELDLLFAFDRLHIPAMRAPFGLLDRVIITCISGVKPGMRAASHENGNGA